MSRGGSSGKYSWDSTYGTQAYANYKGVKVGFNISSKDLQEYKELDGGD